MVESFDETGAGVVYLFTDECFLLFYHQGNYLFSRTIPLPETGGDAVSKFESLSFEINQSAYHFSQRTKSQLGKLFLISRENIDIEVIKEVIGRDISILDEDYGGKHCSEELINSLGLCADFTPEELLPSEKVPGISDRILKKEIETQKIQITGIIIGIILFIILGGEYLFLQNIEYQETSYKYAANENPKEKIENYNQALDTLIYDTEKEKPLTVVGRLAASLPANISFESIEIELEPTYSLNFRGSIKALDVYEFNSTLTSLVKNVNNNLKGSNTLNIDDLEIEMKGKQGLLNYNISFYLDLI